MHKALKLHWKERHEVPSEAVAPGHTRTSLAGGAECLWWHCSGCPRSSTLETAPLAAVGHRATSPEDLQVPVPR